MQKTLIAIGLLLFLLFSAVSVLGQAISGDYIESRSADVYVAQCFANGEAGLAGDQAVLAWHVREGRWSGERLDGLTVVAALKANATLGDPDHSPLPAKSVILVDEQATPRQREALVRFAQHMGGALLADAGEILPVKMDMEVLQDAKHHGRAFLRAGSFVEIQTRPLGDKDHFCGNEKTFYPPLTKLTHSMPAVATTDEYRGPGLGASWVVHDKRSAFIGSFEE